MDWPFAISLQAALQSSFMSILHRMTDAELPALLALLSQSGGTARTADSWSHDHMTALVLGGGGGASGGGDQTPQAAMPLACRTISAGPGRTLAAGWLSSNQFASRMGLRRQTKATAPDWPALLPELDALLVLRRDEPSLAARWYAQTGFADVLSVRCLYLDMEAPPSDAGVLTGASLRGAGVLTGASLRGAGVLTGTPQTVPAGRYHVQVVTPAEGQWDAPLWQNQMFSVYRDVHASTGGTLPRSPDFWRPALAHHYYRDHYQFQLIGLWTAPDSSQDSSLKTQDSLMGYALVGWSGWHSKRPRMDILELATRQWDTAVAGDLIRTTCQLAWSKNVRQVRAVVSVHDPYRGHLVRSGFADRWGYCLQAKWLNPQRYLDQLSAVLPRELGDFWLELVAPGQLPLLLGRGTRSAPATSLTLRGTPATLARLLLGRTDLAAALQDGTLQPAAPLSDADLARLSHCFPWTPWIFHMLDFI
jgi:hypothetical protein